MSYPCTLYMIPDGATCSVSTVVQNEAEHDEALRDGWYDSPACGAAPDEAGLQNRDGGGTSGEGS